MENDKGNGGDAKIGVREKKSVIAPQEGSRVGRGRKGNKNCTMIAAGKWDDGCGGGKEGVVDIHENMVEVRKHGRLVVGSFGKCELRRVSTRKRSIRKRCQDREQTGPGMRSGDRTVIVDRVRIIIPISNKEIKRGKERRGGRKTLKETTAGRVISMSIDVGDFVNLP
jgi:hypothetical protein